MFTFFVTHIEGIFTAIGLIALIALYIVHRGNLIDKGRQEVTDQLNQETIDELEKKKALADELINSQPGSGIAAWRKRLSGTKDKN